jgi:predicted transcriptional regulator
MTTLELKNILIHKISGIDDVTFLNAIKTIIETKSQSIIYNTSPEQKQNIGEGMEQIAKGKFITNEQVESDIDKWFEEK